MGLSWELRPSRGEFEVSRPRVRGWKVRPEDLPCDPQTSEAVNVPPTSPDTYSVERELVGSNIVTDPGPAIAGPRAQPAPRYYEINVKGEIVFVQYTDGTFTRSQSG